MPRTASLPQPCRSSGTEDTRDNTRSSNRASSDLLPTNRLYSIRPAQHDHIPAFLSVFGLSVFEAYQSYLPIVGYTGTRR